MLMNSIGSLFGSGTAHAATPQQAVGSGTPWDSGAANGDLAREAGADSIGDRSAGLHGDDQADGGDFDGDLGGDFGGNVSSGCIRMRNVDVIDLYERVTVGTKVKVL